ncbi:hypothetical protein ACQY0O_006574 [Thecaphora frezii]
MRTLPILQFHLDPQPAIAIQTIPPTPSTLPLPASLALASIPPSDGRIAPLHPSRWSHVRPPHSVVGLPPTQLDASLDPLPRSPPPCPPAWQRRSSPRNVPELYHPVPLSVRTLRPEQQQ